VLARGDPLPWVSTTSPSRLRQLAAAESRPGRAIHSGIGAVLRRCAGRGIWRAYSERLRIFGGRRPTCHSVEGSALGLILSSDGLVSGTPGEAGWGRWFQVTITDSAAGPQQLHARIHLNVNTTPHPLSTFTATATWDTLCKQTINWNLRPARFGSYTWTVNQQVAACRAEPGTSPGPYASCTAR